VRPRLNKITARALARKNKRECIEAFSFVSRSPLLKTTPD
jgi:hypothetical protein